MKLFGTIMYPKNRYLTLQFSRGGKNVTCEDYFDNMVSHYKKIKKKSPEKIHCQMSSLTLFWCKHFVFLVFKEAFFSLTADCLF